MKQRSALANVRASAPFRPRDQKQETHICRGSYFEERGTRVLNIRSAGPLGCSIASLHRHPLHSTGCANLARESQSLSTRMARLSEL
eukprot:10061343-Alexandrium_andersonii.AAC.1